MALQSMFRVQIQSMLTVSTENYSEFLKQAKVVYKVMRLQHKYGEGHCK